MKNESGITLLTLTLYVIGLVIIIGIVGTITNFFMTNLMSKEDSSNSAAGFSKFNIAFIDEVKTYGNSVTDIDETHVTFSSGNKYTFQDGNIYKNKIAIVNDVKACQFSLRNVEHKQIVSVYMELGTVNTFSKSMEYVLSYEEDQLSSSN